VNHPSSHSITQIDHCSVRPTDASTRAFVPDEQFGRSTHSVLASIGYTETEVESMIERGIAGLSWSREYLPS
jgi:crotonobetainyl-CoA:carnitine CoA-transferase CaiB-like acyl-CoA transferase